MKSADVTVVSGEPDLKRGEVVVTDSPAAPFSRTPPRRRLYLRGLSAILSNRAGRPARAGRFPTVSRCPASENSPFPDPGTQKTPIVIILAEVAIRALRIHAGAVIQ